jgi:hypothetical protein
VVIEPPMVPIGFLDFGYLILDALALLRRQDLTRAVGFWCPNGDGGRCSAGEIVVYGVQYTLQYIALWTLFPCSWAQIEFSEYQDSKRVCIVSVDFSLKNNTENCQS